MSERRVVVTGMAVLTPIGDTLTEYYKNLIAGKSAIGLVESIDLSRVVAKIAGDLGKYNFKEKLQEFKKCLPSDMFKRFRKISKTAPFSTRLTLLTAIKTWVESGLLDVEIDRDNVCIILGGHNFHEKYIVENTIQFLEEPEWIDPLMGINVWDTDIIASIAEVLQIYGPMYSSGGTCTSTGIALRHAVNEIKYEGANLALVGGAVLDFSNVGFQAFINVGAISFKKYNENPTRASRPFDVNREGFVPCHGAGFLIVEELEHALARGAEIHAEVLGVASNNDGNHLSQPSTTGQVKVMRKALVKAGLEPAQIDYINAHATSTPLGDKVEIMSIKEVFGEHAYKLKINSTKSILGHTAWASHIIELIASILQMEHSKLHPSINIDQLDPEIDLDVCANKAIDCEITYFIKNSFGFGGINSCSVLKKYHN